MAAENKAGPPLAEKWTFDGSANKPLTLKQVDFDRNDFKLSSYMLDGTAEAINSLPREAYLLSIGHSVLGKQIESDVQLGGTGTFLDSEYRNRNSEEGINREMAEEVGLEMPSLRVGSSPDIACPVVCSVAVSKMETSTRKYNPKQKDYRDRSGRKAKLVFLIHGTLEQFYEKFKAIRYVVGAPDRAFSIYLLRVDVAQALTKEVVPNKITTVVLSSLL
jgi:hypothetical protein